MIKTDVKKFKNPLEFLIPIISDNFPSLRLKVNGSFIDIYITNGHRTIALGWFCLKDGDTISLTSAPSSNYIKFNFNLYDFKIDDLLGKIDELVKAKPFVQNEV